MWKAILGFIPWIIYLVIASIPSIHHHIAILAAVVACLFEFNDLKKGFILPWCTLILFCLLFFLDYFFTGSFIFSQTSLIVNGSLAGVAWGSLAFHKPFTLQYAREQVPKGLWETRGFYRSNAIITAVWAGSFTICGLFNIIHIYFKMNELVYQIATYAPTIIAVWFTMKFPDWYRQRKFEELIERSEKRIVSNPFLKGNFAPIRDELDAVDLPIEGELPKDLVGIYMRNGANPAYHPFSYTYPFEGDGMIHAVYIQNGKASYRNRFVLTDQLQVERRLGKAVYGGVECPFIRSQKDLLPEESTFPVKRGRHIHIIRHANQYVALHEAASAYQMDAQLNTLGEWNPTREEKPISVNPHPRLDPETGELFLISYHTDQAVVSYTILDKNCKLVREGKIEVPQACMIHDFILTKNHFIFFLCPVVIDYYGVAKGKHIFNWEPELNTRIGVVSRKDGSITWIETESFFTYHFVNGYEEGGQIEIDYVRYPKFSLKSNEISHLYHASIDLQKKECRHRQLDDRSVEFPRFNEKKNSSSYRYAYLLKESDFSKFNTIVKYDLKKKSEESRVFPEYELGEAVFVSRGMEEDDGYLMLFGYHRQANRTDFFLLDAKQIDAKPIARIAMPRRVPHGLHGTWMSGPWK